MGDVGEHSASQHQAISICYLLVSLYMPLRCCSFFFKCLAWLRDQISMKYLLFRVEFACLVISSKEDLLKIWRSEGKNGFNALPFCLMTPFSCLWNSRSKNRSLTKENICSSVLSWLDLGPLNVVVFLETFHYPNWVTSSVLREHQGPLRLGTTQH